MKLIIISIYSLMLADIVLTYYALKFKDFIEINPLLKGFYGLSIEATTVIIFIVVTFLIYQLWKHKEKTKHIKEATFILLATRILVVANNVYWLLKV